jgi:hypothetical protein
VRLFPSLRWVFIIFCLIAVLGPLSASTESATGQIRLTSTSDVTGYEWSERGEALLFTRGARTLSVSSTQQQTAGDLYRVQVSGGSAELLVPNANFPSPAPDGNRIAFVSLQNDGSGRLRLLDLGSTATSDVGATDWGAVPQWTHAGDQLIYATQGRLARLNPAAATKLPVVAGRLPLHFAASPRGDRLAFVGSDGLHIVGGTGDVNVFPIDGLASVRMDLRWSHDGARLAFVSTRRGFDPELWLVNANGANANLLLRGKLEYFAGLEWAPDDSNLIFARTPTGSSIANASKMWRITVEGLDSRSLTQDREEESSPKYSPDGTRIAFLRAGDLWVMQLGPGGLPLSASARVPSRAPAQEVPPPPALSIPPNAPAAQLTPPTTIRVMHDQYNTCRNAPVGQIDQIDLETYVKRVVPAEVYSTWPSEALKTQAVAARSYAWFWVVQHTNQSFDVTDSTAYQYMCDNRYASTDAAVDATHSQYGDYVGKVIFAAYGADNGDPTLTNSWGNPYLIGVDDPVDFGDPISGNGIGMSQWGAERWASPPFNWNYQQILIHYYAGITIESPAGATPDTTPPIAAMAMPWSNWAVTSNRLFLAANASDDSSSIATMNFIARYFDGSRNQTVTLMPVYDGTYWDYIADMSSFPDQSGISVTPSVTDPSGNSFSGNGIVITLDRVVPAGSVSAPSNTMSQLVTLHLSASDGGPSGLASMAFSNNWIWPGENQSVTNNSGTVVNDPAALDGKALMGQVGVNPAGYWYGPYTNVLPAGKAYRAYFRLKTDNTNTGEVAMLDVVDNGGANVLGLKRLRGTDFRAANVYQEFYVDFNFVGSVTAGLEFRVAYRASADLWLDRIIVVSYPLSYAPSAQWELTPGRGLKTVQAKFIDGAGNISPDAMANIWFGATPTPVLTPTPTPLLIPRIWLPILTR